MCSALMLAIGHRPYHQNTSTMPSKTLTIAAVASAALALHDGFQRTPVMGWNIYNNVACNPSDAHIRSTINALSAKGFNKVGYSFVQLDYGWQAFRRQPNGSITYDAQLFPYGIKSLSRYAIDRGSRWGMYNSIGVYACDTGIKGRPRTLNYKRQDALMFAACTAAYVKVCFTYGESSSSV